MSTAAYASDTLLTVERGMQVLRAFRAESRARSNAELVQITGLSKATVSRLTSTLIELGFLRRVPGGRQFELSAGPLSIGHAFTESDPVLASAHPFMQELADRLNVSVALAAGDGLDMLYVGYRISRRIATLRMGVGSMLPMATSMIGRAYLWGLPEPDRTARLALARRAFAAQGAKPAALEAWQREIQDAFDDLATRGVCFAAGGPGFQRNAFGIAVPVRVGLQAVSMALSCGSVEPPSRVEAVRRRVEPALLKARPAFEALLADVDVDGNGAVALRPRA